MTWTKKAESFWLSDVFKQAEDYARVPENTAFKVLSKPSERIDGGTAGRLSAWHLEIADDFRSTAYVAIQNGAYCDYEVDGQRLALSLEQFYCLWHRQLSEGGRFILVTRTDYGLYRLRIGEEYNESDY